MWHFLSAMRTGARHHASTTRSERYVSFACCDIGFHDRWCVAAVQAKPKLVAVAALLQDPQLSAIVTLKSSGIQRPAQLDGKRYASYAAR
jgi:hypothetical protein